MSRQSLRVALVTGASSGIGEAVAARLREAGFVVFGTSRRGGELMQLDVRVDESVAACVQQVYAHAGRIDVLVNNAGYALLGAVEECTVEQAQAIFDVNLFGALRMARAVLPFMRSQGSGRIVSISSVVGFIPAPFMAHYAATKHAIEALSESLDHEIRPLGIRAVLVQPSFVKTRIDRNMLSAAEHLAPYEERRTGLRRVLDEAMAVASGPGAVAQAVLLGATAAQPRLRYTVGRDALFLRLARKTLPERVFDRGLRKQFRLDEIS